MIRSVEQNTGRLKGNGAMTIVSNYLSIGSCSSLTRSSSHTAAVGCLEQPCSQPDQNSKSWPRLLPCLTVLMLVFQGLCLPDQPRTLPNPCVQTRSRSIVGALLHSPTTKQRLWGIFARDRTRRQGSVWYLSGCRCAEGLRRIR